MATHSRSLHALQRCPSCRCEGEHVHLVLAYLPLHSAHGDLLEHVDQPVMCVRSYPYSALACATVDTVGYRDPLRAGRGPASTIIWVYTHTGWMLLMVRLAAGCSTQSMSRLWLRYWLP